MLAINGSNLPVIRSMLNHRSLMSTQIYARLSVASVRLVLDDQAERMLGPVSIPRRSRLSSGRHTRDLDAGMAGIEYTEAKAVAGDGRPSGPPMET